MNRIKFFCLLVFFAIGIIGFAGDRITVQPVGAFSTGPPPGMTGAPGESSCFSCHVGEAGPGQFTITAPQSYNPGQTYQIVVQHTSPDPTRTIWGFQLTALAGGSPAGTVTNTGPRTQTVTGFGRTYIQHTLAGTSQGQVGGTFWTFNWTAPSTNVGPVTFYSAGNQGNSDGTASGDRILLTTAASQPPVVPPNDTLFDFDGDAKTDFAIYRPSNGVWWYMRSSTGNVETPLFIFGTGTDVIAPADMSGDGKTDLVFFRPETGQWFIQRSEDNTFSAFAFGANGDIPAPGDFDGDGKADAAVFRPSIGTWFILQSSNGQTRVEQFGINGDQPVTGDYDGDGQADVGIWRESQGIWFINRSTAGVFAIQFGQVGDDALTADFTGDGKSDIAIWRRSTGFWFILRSEDTSLFGFPFGAAGDQPTPGDYDGDGKADAAVFRPSIGTWFAQQSASSGTTIIQWGTNGDRAIPNAFVRW